MHEVKAVVQRVAEARVLVGERVTGAIGRGLVVLLGVHHADTIEDAEWICGKIARLRIFDDDGGAMNCSIIDVAGDVLLVSQFTLLASTRKGNRPSFNDAARPEHAIPLYESCVATLSRLLGRPIATGEFGAMMRVEFVNDGPVTIVLDSRARE